MARKKIGIDSLDTEIQKILREYGDNIKADIDAVGEKCAKKGQTALRNDSPKDRPEYFSGWRINVTEGRVYSSFEVYNKKAPTLTHLLEFGHDIKVNGVIVGRTRPIPHIIPVENILEEEFEKGVLNAIQANS